MKVHDRVHHDRYGPGRIEELDGAQCKVMFDRDIAMKAPRRVWLGDLKPGAPFYEGKPTPPTSRPQLVA